MKSLVLNNLSFSWPQRSLFCSLNATLETGQFCALIGPNGAGKTTLLELLMGFLEPQIGSIEVIGTTPKMAREQIAYVPQLNLFDKEFPITLENLVLGGLLKNSRYGCFYSADEKQQALEMLDKLDLISFAQTPCGSLSGGQMQRGLLARALVSQPKLLFLDEPMSNIDPKGQALVLNILSKLENVTILMVSHNLQTITKHVDLVWCLDEHLSVITPDKICGHFALGLYHPPINL